MVKKRTTKKSTKVKKKAEPKCGCVVKDKTKQVKCDGGGFYFLGFIGASIYYISTATGFWNGVLGVLKAIVWPVFLVYALMKSLGL